MFVTSIVLSALQLSLELRHILCYVYERAATPPIDDRKVVEIAAWPAWQMLAVSLLVDCA